MPRARQASRHLASLFAPGALAALLLAPGCSQEIAPSPDPGGEPPAASRKLELTIENTTLPTSLRDAGSFRKPVGMEQEAPASPGARFAFVARADPGDRLSFATSFVQGNDLFLAPLPEGISLADSRGERRSGDVSAEVRLWDAGTEADEPIGAGAHQAPREKAPFDGDPDPVARVRLASCAGAPCPDPSSLLRVTLSWPSPGYVQVTLEVVAPPGSIVRPDGQTRNVLLSPGAFVVHKPGERPLFAPGEAASKALRELAEEGDPSLFAEQLAAQARDDVAVSPLAWELSPRGSASHGLHSGLGPESLGAQPGSSTKGVLSTGSTWLGPGQTTSMTFEARPGDRLSLLGWYGKASDRIVATPDGGLALLDERGELSASSLEGQLTLLRPSASGAGLEADDPPPSVMLPSRSLKVTLRPVD